MGRVVALALTVLMAAASAAAQSTANDDSCDLSVAPAATLLLPYFEVETAERAQTTIFSITNVSRLPQNAHVTIWTNYGYPVVAFDLPLTGYDVQSIDLYDVIVKGMIAPNEKSLRGGFCGELPPLLAPALLADVRSALTTGVNSTCTGDLTAPRIGIDHGTLATGYVTIDVTRTCTPRFPNESAYFQDAIAFDNVLIGESISVDPHTAGDSAGGSPLVHIRAIPEGGDAGVPTRLPVTFYSRYAGGTADRRQPLPALFAVRVVQDGDRKTTIRIWREGARPPGAGCFGYRGTDANATPPTPQTAGNSFMAITEIVRFDSHENHFSHGCQILLAPCVLPNITFPEASSTPTTSAAFPLLASPTGDTEGWIYLNLNDGVPGSRASQNWVTATVSTDGGFSMSYDAAWLGNGCTPPQAFTNTNRSGRIGPPP